MFTLLPLELGVGKAAALIYIIYQFLLFHPNRKLEELFNKSDDNKRESVIFFSIKDYFHHSLRIRLAADIYI